MGEIALLVVVVIVAATGLNWGYEKLSDEWNRVGKIIEEGKKNK